MAVQNNLQKDLRSACRSSRYKASLIRIATFSPLLI